MSTLVRILTIAAVAMRLCPVLADEPQGRSHALTLLDVTSQDVLSVPKLAGDVPAAGRRVRVTPPEYAGTDVFHTLYLPRDWKQDGPPIPIIFEYTGNYFPQSGSTGEPEDAGLGYCLSGGKYIWVSLPYISKDHKDNAVTWWGDDKATVEYAKQNVPRIIAKYQADPKAVFLCGFSRGAIGVNYIGLHDDEVSKLWTAFVSHDHFDGIRAWGRTSWGSPLEKYRKESLERLKRVGKRPYLVSQNGSKYGTEEYLQSVLPDVENFTFNDISAGQIFGSFPNKYAKTGHTDIWAIKPSPFRVSAWKWMNQVVRSSTTTPNASGSSMPRDVDRPQPEARP